MGAWTYFEVVRSSWMVWFAGLFVLFFMFPYCIITFYSRTYFEGEVLKKQVQWRFLNIPPYTSFWDIYFFFQDSCGAALSLDKNRI